MRMQKIQKIKKERLLDPFNEFKDKYQITENEIESRDLSEIYYKFKRKAEIKKIVEKENLIEERIKLMEKEDDEFREAMKKFGL